jgi:hypothetical protein
MFLTFFFLLDATGLPGKTDGTVQGLCLNL